jgi:LuxR family transcriptional regulator
MADKTNYEPLTNAQREMMLLLADGFRLKQIAHMLNVTQGAVKDRSNRAKCKLDSRTTIQAVARYISQYQQR